MLEQHSTQKRKPIGFEQQYYINQLLLQLLNDVGINTLSCTHNKSTF